ncbi:RecX family transcriptional regulator [Paenibacillus woosongensis]|uniref:Regulatory protein RecX n=1 Tax=Paenibacillus woosongensis TaxID=307580 RepID=A0AA95L2U0_9BACL|nr:RecX family transcriptional regulator [Paenibacillus woosongensis]WHX51161.1 RecX family transcriptional regulator [Paenibacillus woosongensis]
MNGKYRNRGIQPASGKGGRRLQEPQGIVDISEERFWGNTTEESLAVKSSFDDFPDEGELEITMVEALKRPKFRYRIHFGSYSVEIHEDVMIKYRMIKGAVFAKSDLEEIIAADERQRSYGDALVYLSRKPRTAYEIALRLGEKGWSEEMVSDVLYRLKQERLIDDAAYAQEWAKQRVGSRGKGKLWVRHELRQKGIAKPLIEEALGEVSEEDEYNSALQLGAKKWRSTTGEFMDRKRKTGAFLMRRGYSGGLVSKVIRELAQQDGQENTEEWEEE